jgi:Arc-like DNA binding domain
MAPKDQELRPVMTRIPEGLRRRLEREAKWRRRSMNAEIVARLQQSFDIPNQTDDIVSQVESAVESAEYSVTASLDGIQSQIRAILSHLGLPDPVEEAKAREAEARARRAEARKAEEGGRTKGAATVEEALQTIERAGFKIARPSETARPSGASETKHGEKK